MVNNLVILGKQNNWSLPALFSPDEKTAERILEFFTAQIRNPNTRKAYACAVGEFAAWCSHQGISELAQVRPMHVASYIEGLKGKIAAPSVKLKLAAIRVLFDWLVVGQVVPSNPASSVRGPKHVVRKGKTPVLSVDEARELLAGIDVSTLVGLRDRALVALMVYTFARVGAAIKMRVEDVYVQGRRTWVRLHEKGGKRHEMPCHHSLEEYLDAYIRGAGIAADGKGNLFRTARGRSKELTDRPMSQADAYRMIRRRALKSNLKLRVGCQTLRATGIAAYFEAGGTIEYAQPIAAHASPQSTTIYAKRRYGVTSNEIGRIDI